MPITAETGTGSIDCCRLKTALTIFILLLSLAFGMCREPEGVSSTNFYDLKQESAAPVIMSAALAAPAVLPMVIEKQSGRISEYAEHIIRSGRIRPGVSSVFVRLMILQYFISFSAVFTWVFCRIYQQFCYFSKYPVTFVHLKDGKKR